MQNIMQAYVNYLSCNSAGGVGVRGGTDTTVLLAVLVPVAFAVKDFLDDV